ncbi:cell division topological specificity factor MinE [Clostridium beijerinckii]|jgi:cell division topological specificity factor MinE|uniref:Cell division topological specificity factor MinE n=2 Tax=Clostridium beijerinckii TaxID=1520 RepID=A0AAE2V3K0_CLOBE|nr:cell division topological specificity factor MinE [Clostridium beijerinckii]ABR34340.1 Septum formation topological specificity factor MinE [Clostridium beijerinckii NCIMB 8052]AIU03816.1 septum formation topological specificity factor MinE [Clostridium beijerinckii ATCC 35702]MBF7811046.1 cell division topological specificity factor MinE [Clostridium beijerinckii]NRT24350.1 cell division topological specificity factor [Clostridium beijerinckii]NRT68059.1 cell division topological specifici
MMNLFSSTSSSSNGLERERLKLILVHDKTDISSDVLDSMREEILEVIDRHIKTENSCKKMILTQDTVNIDNYSILIASIPMK